jgi:hypothetical protein
MPIQFKGIKDESKKLIKHDFFSLRKESGPGRREIRNSPLLLQLCFSVTITARIII